MWRGNPSSAISSTGCTGGVDEVVLIVGQWGDRVVEYVQGTIPSSRSPRWSRPSARVWATPSTWRRRPFADGEPALIVLGDTIFQADLKEALRSGKSAIGVRRVPNPSQFGVVELDGERVRRLVEKPGSRPSDLAIVGIYYVRDSDLLVSVPRATSSPGRQVKGEYQLTDGLQRMIEKGRSC